MKNLLIPFLLLIFSSVYSQTKLASHPLKLKKSPDYHQILNAVDSKNQVFVFASDKEDFHLLKFNSALFFADSLHLKRPERVYEIMAGYSFGKSREPYVYWTSEDFKKIQATEYNLNNKTVTNITYELTLKDESVISTFTEKNTFYIFTQSETDDFLKLYAFTDGILQERELRFSDYKFTDSRNKPAKFHEILSDYPIEKMDSKAFNPLLYSVSKSKFYVNNNTIRITLDHNSVQTQIFSIDLSTFSINESIITQPILQNSKSQSNSFLSDEKLYQLRLNDTQLVLDIKEIPSGQLIKNFSIFQQDSIRFKNTPFFIQNGNQRPRELKNTQKFLKRISASDIGLSVYETQGNYLLTIGRAKNVPTTGIILVGVGFTVGAAMGGSVMVDDLFDETTQTIYFESLLDKKLQHNPNQLEPLAVDYVSEFLASNERIRNHETFFYDNFFILGYYDYANEEYVLRKFQDGFN